MKIVYISLHHQREKSEGVRQKFSILKVTRFSQELLAGRVFETPVLRDP